MIIIVRVFYLVLDRIALAPAYLQQTWQQVM